MKDAELIEKIKVIHHQSHKTYGSPRIHAALKQQGITCGKHRVERLMRQNGLASKIKRKYIKTTDSTTTRNAPSNLLRRDFKPTMPNRVWASDVTYVWTKEGWIYLSVTLDLFSRAVIGWQMKDRLDSKLCIDSLTMGATNRCVTRGLIHHSDQGKEYASREFRAKLTELKIVQSMSRKGDCWDNAPVESFFHSLKSEMEGVFNTKKEAMTWCFEWIEIFYNRQRLHSSLGYLPPLVYERRLVS